MDTVISADGTPIAYARRGAGPPLVLVHGSIAAHNTTWRFVLPRLEQHFTVYRMDRRGRGASGDAPDYVLQREAEDIAALVNQIGQPAHLLGHSFGALCCLEAALLTPSLRRLVLYEGLITHGAGFYPPGMLDHLEVLRDAGDREGLLMAVLRELLDMPPDEIALLQSQSDAWQVRLANALTVPRESRAEEDYVFDPARFNAMGTPTLLLVGGASAPSWVTDTQTVAAALPDATITILPGQGHLAMYTAPDLFVDTLLAFLHPQ
jgi:pimeloyl-ACP methyl ester carboxylesterase